MQCQALTKKGHPCRGYGTLAEGSTPPHLPLCHKHTHFFETDAPYRLLERRASLFQQPEEREWMVRMVSSPLFRWNPSYESKLLADSRSNDWFTRDRASYIYDVLVRAEKMKATAIQSLWRRRVTQQLTTLQYTAAQHEGNPPYYREMILTLLAPYFRGTDPLLSMTLLLNTWKHYPFHTAYTNIPLDISGQMWSEILETTMSVTPMRAFACFSFDRFIRHIDGIHAKEPFSLWHNEEHRDTFIRLLRAHRDAARAALKVRINTFKEELMAATWSPERVEAALAAGLDVEDM